MTVNDRGFDWEKSGDEHLLFDPYKLKTGDIINALDFDSKWHETLVRAIGTKENNHECMKAVHYIGWSERWDEWINIEHGFERLKPRYEKIKGPHIANRSIRKRKKKKNNSLFTQRPHLDSIQGVELEQEDLGLLDFVLRET